MSILFPFPPQRFFVVIKTASGKELIFIFWFIVYWLDECSSLIDEDF